MRWLAVMALSGCVEWTAPQMVRQQSSPTIELRRDQLPGSGVLLADGRFRFRIDVDHLCRKTVRERQSIVVDKKLTIAGKMLLIGGAVMTLVGVKFVTEGDHGTANGVRPARIKGGLVFLGWGTVFLGAPLFDRYANGPSRRGTESIDQPVSAIDVPCEPSAVLGELDVVTPWGTRARSPIASDGSAQFALDWTNVDPKFLSSAWQIQSTTGLTAYWMPTPADREIALQLGHY